MRQHPAGDLVLAREPHVRLGTRVGEEPIQHSDAVGVSVNAVVESHKHHAPPIRAFFVELVEFVL